jgi:hypothetical protein
MACGDLPEWHLSGIMASVLIQRLHSHLRCFLMHVVLLFPTHNPSLQDFGKMDEIKRIQSCQYCYFGANDSAMPDG